MEFDIGNLLYVIITIVAIAIGLLGRKKKPAQQGSGDSGSARRPGFLENLERILNQNTEAGVAVEMEEDMDDLEEMEEAPVFTAKEEPTGGGILEEYERTVQRMRDTGPDGITGIDAGEITESLEVVQLEEDEGTDYFEVVEEFNAATAVVYSAIINRIDY